MLFWGGVIFHEEHILKLRTLVGKCELYSFFFDQVSSGEFYLQSFNDDILNTSNNIPLYYKIVCK